MDLFFLTKIKDIETMGIIINPRIKDKWTETQKGISANVETYQRNIQMLIDITHFKKDMTILDIGCGFGQEIIELANLGGNCVGIDAVEDYSNLITTIGKTYDIKVKGDFGDACALPYENETFDIVMSRSFFEHLKDFDIGMKEQIRVLRKGGKLIVRDGNFLCPLTLYDLLIKYPRRTNGKYGGIRWLFTKGKVRENLYEVGGWTGKDEDVHSIFWWKRKMKNYQELRVEEITTTRGYKTKEKLSSAILKPFLGSVLVIAVKK